MSVQQPIFATLDGRLAAFTPVMPTAWPNVAFTPGTTAYLKVDHLPAPSVRRSIGADGQNVYTGIYQVVVNYPPNQGPGLAESRADAVANWFPIGSTYTANGVTVRIAAVSCAPAKSEPDWYRVPVSITYEAVTSA